MNSFEERHKKLEELTKDKREFSADEVREVLSLELANQKESQEILASRWTA